MRWAFAVAVLLLLPAPAGATQFAVSRTPLHEGGDPQAARSERSGAIVLVWGLDGEDVHSALLAADGRRVSLADRDLGAGRHPAIAYDVVADRFLVVTEAPGAARALLGLLLDGEGLPIGVPFTIADGVPPDSHPAVTHAPAGGFTVAYARETALGIGGIDVRRVGADGTLGPERRVAARGLRPAIAPGLVAWSSPPGAVQMHRLDATGTPRGTAIALAGAPRPLPGPPAVAQDPERDRWIVGALDDRSGLQLLAVGPDGATLAGTTARARRASLLTRPAIALGGGGELDDGVVAWRARQVRARPLALAGLRTGSSYRVSSGPPGAATSPVAVFGGERAVIAYDARAASGRRHRIAARRYTLGEPFDARPPRVTTRRDGLRVRIRCSEPCSIRVLRSPPFRRLRGRVYGRRYTLALERRGRVRLHARDRSGNPRTVRFRVRGG